MGDEFLRSWELKILLTDRQNMIIKNLRIKDAGKHVAAFDKLEKGAMTFSEIDTLCNVINAEFLMEGILPNFEPNEYGIELERLLDVINRPRLK
jgi:hypothetical protein